MTRLRWFGLSMLLATPLLLAAGGPDVERQQELRQMLLHDCGSCHGLTMQGGLGPALSPLAMDGKSIDYLSAVILHGRPGTAMPPWRSLLTGDEARWLAQLLKQGVRPGNDS